MSAKDEIRRTFVQLEAMVQDVFVGTVVALHGSIQTGSAVTAAPGQPVDTGALRNSWLYEFPTATTATISTNLAYAQAVEDGVGPHGPRVYGKKNNIGGSHSVALTIAGAQRVVDQQVQRVAGIQGTVIDDRSGIRGEDGG